MSNGKMFLMFAIVGAVLLLLFRGKAAAGFLAPTSGNLPITGYVGAHPIGTPLSSLPPTQINLIGDAGPPVSYTTTGPTLPPGYDPNDPSTWPADSVFNGITQRPGGVTLPMDLATLYAGD